MPDTDVHDQPTQAAGPLARAIDWAVRFCTRKRHQTESELRLSNRVATLELTLADRELRISTLKNENSELDSRCNILKAEVNLLSEVLARDRARIAAETARWVQVQAEAETYRQQGA